MARTKHKSPEVGPFKELVERAGFCYTSMRDQVQRGNLAIVKVGRRWYLEAAELQRFVERNTERRTEEQP